MNFRIPFWRSFKVRIILVAMAVFVLGVWSLALYAGCILHADLQKLLGEQQLSTATIVAAEINQQFDERLRGLNLIAKGITPAKMTDPAALQRFLESHVLLRDHFNSGFFVVSVDGTALASVPARLGRIGVNFMDRDHIAAALKQDRPTVSEPVIGKLLKAPVISIAAPIHDSKGKVIGALSGVVNLAESNFLDLIIGHHYGSSGSYFLVEPRQKRIVTATDKDFNLKPLSPPNMKQLAEDLSPGSKGYGTFVNAEGVEYLLAAHAVPVSGWALAVQLPVAEAFAPIRGLESRLLRAAALVTALATLLIWWMLQRALVPLQNTARALAELPDKGSFPAALPVVRNDEVGRVVTAFNRLLSSLRTQDLALRQSEAQLQDAQAIAGLGIYVLDGVSGTWSSSHLLDTLFGIDAAYERTVEGWLAIVHPHDRQRMQDYLSGLIGSHSKNFDATYRIVRPCDGATRWMHGLGRLEYDGGGGLRKMPGIIQDVTESMLVQLRLGMLSRITEQAPIAIVITNLDGTIEYVNPQFEKVTGYSFQEAVGQNPRILQSGQTDPKVYLELWDSLTSGEVWQGEFQNQKKNGEWFVERAVIAPVHNVSGVTTHYVALKENITERKRAQVNLQESLREKTALLNEVHHRVKNNLQVIASLLRLEANRSSASDTRSVLGEMQGRIRSMALVHEALYRSGNFAAVELKSYLEQVATGSFRAQSSSSGAVRLVLELSSVHVSLDQATPCGLLVNELISNSVKHGFPDDKQGVVHVVLQSSPSTENMSEMCRLQVWDTGIGLPREFELIRTQSLGLQLVGDLSNQLGGKLAIGKGGGASFTVTFPLAKI